MTHKEFDLKTVIEANTTENGINLDAVMQEVNTKYVDSILASKQDKFQEKARANIETEFISSLGYEGVNTKDDLSLRIKQWQGNTDETKEAHIKLQNEYSQLKTSNEDLTNQLSSINPELQTLRNQMMIIKKGLEGNINLTNDDIEFIDFKISKKATNEEEYAQLLNEHLETLKPKRTNGRFVNDKKTNSIQDDFNKAFGVRK